MFKIGGGNLKRLIKMCKKRFTLNLFTSFIIRVSNIFRTFAPELWGVLKAGSLLPAKVASIQSCVGSTHAVLARKGSEGVG